MIEVILCTYNGEKFIEKQLDSIRCQTRVPDKVNIYDDISTDNTVKIVNDYIAKYNLSDCWNVCINVQNKGWRKNFYDAIIASLGDIIFFSDQDDIWELDKIEVMSDAMLSNEEILKLNSYFYYIDENDNRIFSKKNINMKCNNSKIIEKEKFLDKFCGKWNHRLACSSAISGKLRDLLTGIPYSFSFSHDWLLENIAGAIGGSFVIDYYSIRHRLHDVNASNNSPHNVEFYIEYGKYINLIFYEYLTNVDKKYIKAADKFLKFTQLREKANTKFAPFAWLKLSFYLKYYVNGIKGLGGDLLRMLHLKK